MGDNIPVPAESIRRMSENAVEEVRYEREQGRTFNADDIQECISEALDVTRGRRGEFVSVDASTASTLVAFGASGDAPESGRHREAVRHYLEQYGYW